MKITYDIKYKSKNKLGQEHIFDTWYSQSNVFDAADNLEAILENTEFNHRMEVLDDMTEKEVGDHYTSDDLIELNEAWYGTECSLIKVNISITNLEEK